MGVSMACGQAARTRFVTNNWHDACTGRYLAGNRPGDWAICECTCHGSIGAMGGEQGGQVRGHVRPQ